MTKSYILAIDQGTTNSRAIIFDQQAQVVSIAEKPLSQSFPQPGWVEQSPLAMVANILFCCRQVVSQAQLKAKDIAAIGITNQRETTILWNKQTGEPIYPAIVWQDRRTSDGCAELKKDIMHEYITTNTGLMLDPYFSATKIQWILNHVKGARQAAAAGNILFGTVDTFLIWHLTKEHAHVTDATNAARTLLFNIHTQQWDEKLLGFFDIPSAILPKVLDSAAEFGYLAPHILGEKILIAAVAGDQQAATIGQACFDPGMVKITYGTGGFLLANTGATCVQSQNKLLSTVLYRLSGKVIYGLEGSFFSAGETIKWLRDNLQLFTSAADTEKLIAQTTSNLGMYFIPAFTGLGAPYWQPQARASILGIERGASKAHIIRAAIESVAYQSKDLLLAMQKDITNPIRQIRVDGGMTANKWLLQFLADILQVSIEQPTSIETTARGVAFLAGLATGLYPHIDDISHLWQVAHLYQPLMPAPEAEQLYTGWLQAIKQILFA